MQPLTVDEWIRGWVDPVMGLLTLATGEREEINGITLTSSDPDESPDTDAASADITGYLYGSGIHQRVQPAERRIRADGSSVAPLFLLDSAPPFAGLIQAWGTDLAEQTATTLYRLSLDPSLPTTVRYLLSVQALESLDARAREEIEAQDDASHRDARHSAVAALDALEAEVLPRDASRFIRDNLARRPYRSLSGRLNRIMSEVPDADKRRDSWTRLTEPLGAALEGLERPAAPLHERLASTRNVLSHGEVLESSLVSPATRILQSLLRGELLRRLGFGHDELAKAFDCMDRQHN